MSAQSVEFVRILYGALDRGDDEAVLGLLPPEFLVDFSRRLIEPQVLPRDQFLAFYDRVREAWDEGKLGWEPERLIDAGDKVVAFIRTGGRGKSSGALVETHVWNVWTFRDGKAVSVEYFGEDQAAALEAAGLSD